MSDLDEKLRKYLKEFALGMDNPVVDYVQDEAITQIKQAFADEGFIKIPQGEVGNVDGVKIFSINGDSNIMTGHEWYDRFEKEAPGSTEPHVFEAAKRAAGISDE